MLSPEARAECSRVGRWMSLRAPETDVESAASRLVVERPLTSIPGTSALAHSNSCARPSHSTCVLDNEDPDCSRLVVDGSAADLMVGVEEGFVEERADVTT